MRSPRLAGAVHQDPAAVAVAARPRRPADGPGRRRRGGRRWPPAPSSLATSSDCTTTGKASSTGSTMYSIAATARWVSDTSRVERTRTRRPVGEIHSTERRQRAGAHVEHALVVDQGAVAQVERLVLDEQPDDLAVGDVDHRLAVLRDSRSRPPRRAAAASRRTRRGRSRAARRARPRRGCRAARGARWPARTPTRSRPAGRGAARSRGSPTARPGTPDAGSRAVVQQLSQVLDHDARAVLAQRRRPGRPGRRRPRSRSARRGRPGPRPARPRTPPRARRDTPSALAPARNVSGCGLPLRCCSSAVLPSTRASNRSSIPAAISTSRQLALEETTARRSPASRAALT